MPISQPPNNIIEFGRQDTQTPGSRAFAAVRALAQQRLGTLADGLYGSVDDALFDLAERAGNSLHQSRFFDGMREIRKKRQRAQIVWLDLVGKCLTALERNEALKPRRAAPRGTDNLSLVDEGDLEENLAIAAMGDKAIVRLNRALYALEQRLSQLFGGRKVDSENNPLGPRLLSEAFGQSLEEFELDVEVRLIVLKLFERHVIGVLDGVYDEVNSLLVQQGVMPELRYQLPGRRSGNHGGSGYSGPTSRTSTPTDRDGDPAATLGTYLAESVPEDSEQQQLHALLGELTQLLQTRRSTGERPIDRAGPVSAQSAIGQAAAPSPREMLNALSLLQSELQSRGIAASGPTSSADLKNELLEQIRALSGGQRPVALGGHEDLIDIVGMIFDYAVQDRNLPAPIAALLGRLQIPYLKVALIDRSFIARHDHPARHLLDELARSAIGWTEESDRDGRLIGQIRSIVDRLHRDFEDDVGIFRRLDEEFQAFLDSNRKRAELSERRATETARGRERLDLAQRSAAQAIMARVGGRELPVHVREFLTRRWSNYLVLTHLRHGEESSAWQHAVRFVDELAWSVAPKDDESERRRLAILQPELESTFRQGMQTLGLHPNLTEDLWKAIASIHARLTAPGGPIRELAARDEYTQTDDLAVRFASTRPGEEIIISHEDLAEIPPGASDVEIDGGWLEMARALKAGTWIEFIKDDGTRERAKLLWISTIRALYLFVNRNGVKIAEKSDRELAGELKQHRAIILEQVALVDRALDEIVRRLRSNAAASADDQSTDESTDDPTTPTRD
jgi:hypothetical protein